MPFTTCEALEPRRVMDAGQLDASFGDDGHVERAQPAAAEGALLSNVDVDVTPHGQPVVTSLAMLSTGGATGRRAQIYLTRSLPGGGVDPRFGDAATGRVTIDVPADALGTGGGLLFIPRPTSVITPDDGVLTTVGYRLFKTRSNGTADKSFGTRGRLAVSGFKPDLPMGLDVDPQGRIYVAGAVDPDGALMVRRFNVDGSPDISFGQDGAVLRPGQNEARFSAVRVLADGDVLVACVARPTEPGDDVTFPAADTTAVRLDDDGALDTSYGDDGVARETHFYNELFTVGIDKPYAGADGRAFFVRNATSGGPGSFDEDNLVGFDPAGEPFEGPGVGGDDDLFERINDVFSDGRTTAIVTSTGVELLGTDLNPVEAPTANAAASLEGFTAQRLAQAPDGTLLVVSSPTNEPATLAVHRLFGHDSPVGLVAARALREPRTTSYHFTVTWRDDDEIDVSTLGDDDVTVLFPDGRARRTRLLGTTVFSDSLVVATYGVTSPDGTWDADDRGRYRIRANSRAVRDVAGNAAERRAIGVFDVSTLAILPATSALGRATDATGDGDPRNARLADELPA